ncbi:MAG: bifunctional DNA-formamidopyrimidine glycosylase/DNA-(apurinic or apyrimidinic site) lyase [Patescibacteria group bacterium]
MPELPEVEITRQKLQPHLRGRRILKFWTDWPRGLKLARPEFVARDIRGRRILDITRRGKVLFLQLSPQHGSGQAGRPERFLAFHQRMSGRLDYSHILKNMRIKPERWTHVVLRFAGGGELRLIDPRKFGIVWYGTSRDLRADPYLAHLGDDAAGISIGRFLAIARRGRGMVKPFLLRQDRLAGIGNIIADESLWRARIHPRSRLEILSPVRRHLLHRAITSTIRMILSSGGTSLRNWGHPDGRPGHFQELRLVYGRPGQPCPRCRAKLKRLIVAGRGTTICPRCQRV